MARRPTVQDVAREAGVSVTTVDRALNGRLRVREDTLRKIADAAHRVGYHARGLLSQNLDAAKPEVTFGFVLIKKAQEFYQNFAREIETAIAARPDIRGRAIIRYASSQSPDDFAEALKALGPKCDAVAAVAVNHQRLTQAVQELQADGVPVFSLLNDFAQGVRRNYLGLNNMKIGRVAAWMVTGRARRPGKLAVFVGGNRWHGHDLREVGFRSYVRENAPEFTVLETLVNLETRQLTYEATLDLVRRHPDLAGIYIAGGGMEGAIAAMRELHASPRIALVVNELTDDSRAALADGYVTMAICTPLAELCTDLVDLMLRATQGGDGGIAGQHFLDPRIILPEMA
ncbi:LacI family DNA-binding transcriptional regulator [Roseinatronobacter alkalisoli]|uniref:LacI family DNA-binding transcriptional regulator n=1 Tax=Roseinatronobacter alkalisoli TaxID=3028235 RepID=A0ABT5T9Y1_9RHOB|nr:LacI family DNA-binding transcriptional regulator [Roseinatronobacter sp. HJB301]MDD7971889.1 LacI family DNA-binding transcriptional regulator [Roseinatronobacter sp. HJB301]